MKQESLSPIVIAITLAVMKNIYKKKFPREKIERIDSELVPRISEKVRERMMGVGKTGGVGVMQPIRFRRKQPTPTRIMPLPWDYQILERYNLKIEYLLRDVSVNIIECPGPDKQLFIFRHGVRQLTKVILTKNEIKDFLEKIARESRVPLIEGIFRIAVDNFVVNAVVSEEIGSRFVLKKVF